MSFMSTVVSSVVIVLSWIMSVVFAFGVSFVLVKLNILNCWYSSPKFSFFLFGFPAMFGMLMTHYIGNYLMKKVKNEIVNTK